MKLAKGALDWSGITRYTHVKLTRGVKIRQRTASGKRVLKVMQQCLAAGGYVEMNTFYIRGCEFADITLTWDGLDDKTTRHRRGRRGKDGRYIAKGVQS